MKQTFETPKVQVVRFEAVDIVTASTPEPPAPNNTLTVGKTEIKGYETITQ